MGCIRRKRMGWRSWMRGVARGTARSGMCQHFFQHFILMVLHGRWWRCRYIHSRVTRDIGGTRDKESRNDRYPRGTSDSSQASGESRSAYVSSDHAVRCGSKLTDQSSRVRTIAAAGPRRSTDQPTVRSTSLRLDQRQVSDRSPYRVTTTPF